MKLLSIVVPVYNEELNVEPLYQAVNSALQGIADRYCWKFVFTDNCSTDRTYERLGALAARDSRVRAYRLTRNFGFRRSQLILDFVKHWEAGYRIVFGVRRSRDEPARMRAARRLFHRLIAWLSSDEPAHDAGDFRLMSRNVLDPLHGCSDQSPYLRGYISSLGCRQLGVPYDRAKRRSGTSAFGWGALVDLALDGIVCHSILPLRLASVVRVSLSGLALLGIGIYAAMWFTGPPDWPAGFATLAMLPLISLALNAMLLGIIGEYLARIYWQVRPGPLTIVERFIDRTDPAVSDPPGRSSRMVAASCCLTSKRSGAVDRRRVILTGLESVPMRLTQRRRGFCGAR
jgi:dolichol-phosphate mannosyltransferase